MKACLDEDWHKVLLTVDVGVREGMLGRGLPQSVAHGGRGRVVATRSSFNGEAIRW